MLPYICGMDNKQLTAIIKKTMGKKLFPFECDGMKGTLRFISIKEMSYRHDDGEIAWAKINVEVDIIEDSHYYKRMSENGWYTKSAVTRRRNNNMYWEFPKSMLHSMLRFYGISSSKVNKFTYKKKKNDVQQNPNRNLNQETSQENCQVLR
jgi:hypothetical protein